MTTRISFVAVGHATSLFIVISYSLCVIFDLIFPDYAMYKVWQVLLPGFSWISVKSFAIGLLESYAYGWYFALVWVPLYNVFVVRQKKN